MVEEYMSLILVVAGIFTVGASLISFWLIMRHQQNMTNLSVQSKIVGIIWMIPIYAIDSFLGLWMPDSADYVNMLRDCYEAYVLYLFMSLMLSYLGCEDEECEYRLVTYLEKLPTEKWSFPFNMMCGEELPKGREFLKYCKFGTLQYCVVRPLTTAVAMLLDQFDLYRESELNFHYGYVYILILMNVSIGYAFIVLASFYTNMKYKLKPYEPVGKFLCIKCVIFFAFWQSVVITCLVKVGVITDIGIYDARKVSTGLQDFLICVEMFLAAIAFTYTFSYIPFTEGYVNEKELSMERAEHDAENQEAMTRFIHTEPSFTNNYTYKGGTKHGSKRTHKGPGLGLLNALRSANAPVSRIYAPTPGHRAHAGEHSTHSTGDVPDLVKSGAKYQLIEMTQDEVVKGNHGAQSAPGGGSNRAGSVRNPVQYSPPVASISHAHVHAHSSIDSSLVEANRAARSNGYSSSHIPSHPSTADPHTIVGKAGDLLNKHFAARSAIRDFNQTMPMVLPTGFEMHRGIQVNSDPEARLRALEEENRLLNDS